MLLRIGFGPRNGELIDRDQFFPRNRARTMTQPQPYVPTAREQKVLESVEEGRYEREIISGLAPFFHEKGPADMLNFYSKDELTRLQALKGTDRDVEAR